jgi:hypothetical protein
MMGNTSCGGSAGARQGFLLTEVSRPGATGGAGDAGAVPRRELHRDDSIRHIACPSLDGGKDPGTDGTARASNREMP